MSQNAKRERESNWNKFVEVVKHQNYFNEKDIETTFVVIFHLIFNYPLNFLKVQKEVQVNRQTKQYLDLLIPNKLVAEFKSPSENLYNHIDQLVSYLRQQKLKTGLLLNDKQILVYDDDKQKIVLDLKIKQDAQDGELFYNYIIYKENEEDSKIFYDEIVEKFDKRNLEISISKYVIDYTNDQEIIKNIFNDNDTRENRDIIAQVRENLKKCKNYYEQTESNKDYQMYNKDNFSRNNNSIQSSRHEDKSSDIEKYKEFIIDSGLSSGTATSYRSAITRLLKNENITIEDLKSKIDVFLKEYEKGGIKEIPWGEDHGSLKAALKKYKEFLHQS